MSTAALDPSRDLFAPRRPGGTSGGLVLALIAHALLIAALAWGVRWHASEPEGLVAELWSSIPQQAAPRAVPAPPPEPVRPPVREPTPPPEPKPRVVTPPPPPRVDPQIAIERAAREKAARVEAEREEHARLADRRRVEQQKQAETRRLEAERERVAETERKKKEAEQVKRDEARLATAREANLKRMMTQAGGAEAGTAGGTAARTSGPSAGYAGRIKARIKPNIVLTGTVSGNPTAEVEVRVAPDGTIVGRRITKSSGSPVWDETVLRAIDKTEVLPKDVDGRVPSVIAMEFRPLE